MTEDRSLDEFAATNTEGAGAEGAGAEGAGAEGAGAEGAGAEGAGAEGAGAETDTGDADASSTVLTSTDAVEPAVSTSTWTAGGADCNRCGDRVERLWRDDGAVVCADCKEW